ncbi:MAG: prepilin peptidase [Pirellulaceae bacterium]
MILLAPLLLLLAASVIDLWTREIPDWVSVVLMAIGCLAACFGWAGIRWWTVVSGAGVGLGITCGLFRFGSLGGGDAKLITALGAVLGPVGLLFALFWMALAGGVLALIAMARGQRDYAYGPAIAAGYCGYLIWPAGMLS